MNYARATPTFFPCSRVVIECVVFLARVAGKGLLRHIAKKLTRKDLYRTASRGVQTTKIFKNETMSLAGVVALGSARMSYTDIKRPRDSILCCKLAYIFCMCTIGVSFKLYTTSMRPEKSGTSQFPPIR